LGNQRYVEKGKRQRAVVVDDKLRLTISRLISDGNPKRKRVDIHVPC